MDTNPDKPRMVIEFENFGSAHFQLVEIDPRITPLQLMALAGWMQFKANFVLEIQEQEALEAFNRQQEMNRIVVPEGSKRLLK